MADFTSSKGSQDKWQKGNYFYKRDYFGGEAEAEFLVSEFFRQCGIKDYVAYEKVGPDLCRSKNFIPEDGTFITMYRLLQQSGVSDRSIEATGKLPAAEQYLFLKHHLQSCGFSDDVIDHEFARLFEIDRLTLNVDRHFNNFGVLFVGGKPKKLITLFDFGYALGVTFARTTPDFVIVRKSKARTIGRSFDKQCNVLPAYRFNIPMEFRNFLEQRGTREADLFLQNIKTYYKD